MESDHRLGIESEAGGWTGMVDAVLRCARWLVFSSVLMACGSSWAGDQSAGRSGEGGEVARQTTDTPKVADEQDTAMPEAADQDADTPKGASPEPEMPKVEDRATTTPDASSRDSAETEAAHQGAGMPEVENRDTDATEAAQKLPIIVNLVVDEAADAGDGALAAVTARVMERLKETMQSGDLAAVQTFGSLPAIALPADGALMARLLAMPEVQSIELDRELQPLDDAASELRFD